MALMSRFPDWLYKGVKLVEPRLPIQLSDDDVSAVLDIGQGGRAFSDYSAVETTHGPAALPATDLVIVPGDPDLQQYVWYIMLTNAAASDWLNATLFLREIGGTGRIIRLLIRNVGIGGTVPYEEMVSLFGQAPQIKSGPFLFIPPSWELVLSHSATLAGDERISTLLLEKIPTGFGPAY